METKVKEEVKEKVQVEVKVEGVQVREDLNDMVEKIKFKEPETDRYGNVRNAICKVKLFTGYILDFADRDGLYDLLLSFQQLGERDFIKSVKLVEEVKNGKVDLLDDVVEDGSSTYFCVKYELSNGRTFRLFPVKKFVARNIIENYYKKFKQEQKK